MTSVVAQDALGSVSPRADKTRELGRAQLAPVLGAPGQPQGTEK